MLTLDVRTVVIEEIKALLDADTADDLGDVTAETELSALGLNSLAFARLIIRLESAVGADPFGEGRSLATLRTVGALAEAYEQALRARKEA
ncbi:phosphopantetheine-binding protein [Kitasatospora brasiliensis]|uniref:phosphopantetheine-binding protein n=1 Tax=Kitasatospora brasiliensis TaxID=3058040 RepID=UPI00292F9142|nr:phosphopantetheine-binding protein [Kitasatospora sp. K002]